jgi:hypothetical protein
MGIPQAHRRASGHPAASAVVEQHADIAADRVLGFQLKSEAAGFEILCA